MSKYEYVNQPKHYQGQSLAVIDVIREFDLNFALGNVVKYALRAGKKPDEDALRDLEKALWYLQDEIKSVRESQVREENERAVSQAERVADITTFARANSVGGWGAVAVPSAECEDIYDEILNPERDD